MGSLTGLLLSLGLKLHPFTGLKLQDVLLNFVHLYNARTLSNPRSEKRMEGLYELAKTRTAACCFQDLGGACPEIKHLAGPWNASASRAA